MLGVSFMGAPNTQAAKDFAKKNKILKLIDSSDLMDDMKKSLA